MPRPSSCSSGPMTRTPAATGGPTTWGPAAPTAGGPSRTMFRPESFWRWWTGTTETLFTFWDISTPGGWAARRTFQRAWSTSRRPATMPRPGRSCGATKRPSSASGCGGEFSQADRTAQERETEPFNGPSGPRRECAVQAFSPQVKTLAQGRLCRPEH